MIRRLTIVLVGLSILASCGFQNRKGYYYDNHRFNYVRAENFKGAADKNINHPYSFTEPQISTTLKMIEIKKGVAFTSNEKIKSVFDSYSIGKLTPHIVKAFSEIGPDQRVGFSFLMKTPYFVLKNDRLTVGWMWVEDGKLHVDFDIIYAKINQDINKRGYEAIRRIVSSSRGLRVELDIQPGQEYGDSTRELVIDPAFTAQVAEERIKKEEKLAELGVEIEDSVKIEVVKDKSVRERIRELKALRKERMITEEEFQAKKKELLEQL